MGKNMKKEEGVSPVIAVMLILGLTVVLLGMAAAMFMGITSNATDNLDTSYLQPTYEWDVIKIVYNANGGTGTVPVDEGAPHNPGDIVTVAGEGDLTRSGYDFDRWNTKSDTAGDSYSVGSKLVINEYTALYAIWREIEFYTVSYCNDGFDYAPMPENPSNKVGTLTTIANVEGGLIINWSGSNGVDYEPGKTYDGSDGDITLTANWK